MQEIKDRKERLEERKEVGKEAKTKVAVTLLLPPYTERAQLSAVCLPVVGYTFPFPRTGGQQQA